MGEKTDDVRRLRQEEIYGETMRVDTTNPPLETETYTTGARRGDRELEGIRSEIERTRAEMSETLNAIQYRLSPDYLRGQAREKVRDATVGRAKHMAGKAGRKARSLPSALMEKMKDNPLPAALMGLGLGWLMMGGSKDRSEKRYYSEKRYRQYAPEGWYGVEEEEYMPESMYHAGLEEPGEGVYRAPPYYGSEGGYDVRQKAHEASGKMKETAESVKERASETVSHARETAGEYASQARETAGQYASQVRETAQEYAGEVREKAGRMAGQVRERTEHMGRRVRERAGYYGSEIRHGAERARGGIMDAMEDNPLMVAAATFAVGALVGLILPETRRESELMGDMRDELLERAEETGREAMQKVQRVAGEAQRAAKEEAEKQNLTGQDIKEKAERVAEEATNAAKKEAGRQNLTGQGLKEEVKNVAEEGKTAAQREAREQGLIK
jgi:ElaB/YqjD/DUF883 family membrane-anchored ribosome-binding protein